MKLRRTRRLRPGDRLGRNLTVLGDIDPGSADPVHIVWHHEAWCPMACKVFGSMPRAEKEAATLASLAHPNIVRVLGIEPPGVLLMPFLDGSPLSMMIDNHENGRLSISAAMRVAIHIGGALHYVHTKGLVHLDVKPCNVIIAGGGLPVLFDFGTARRIGAPRPPEITGTDPYIAPEECRKEIAGPPADVFGLGVTVYEMIIGQLPFGEPTGSEPFPQMVRSLRPLRSLRKNAPAALERLLGACLSDDPADRPSMPELLMRLNSFITNGPAMWPPDFSPAAPIVDQRPRKIPVRQRTGLRQSHVNCPC